MPLHRGLLSELPGNGGLLLTPIVINTLALCALGGSWCVLVRLTCAIAEDPAAAPQIVRSRRSDYFRLLLRVPRGFLRFVESTAAEPPENEPTLVRRVVRFILRQLLKTLPSKLQVQIARWWKRADVLLSLLILPIGLLLLFALPCAVAAAVLNRIFGSTVPWEAVALSLIVLAVIGFNIARRALWNSLLSGGLQFALPRASGRGLTREASARVAQLELSWPESLMARTAARAAKTRALMTIQDHKALVITCTSLAWLPSATQMPSGIDGAVFASELVAIFLANVLIARSCLLRPRKVVLQLDILRCLAQPPEQMPALGYGDPIGFHRALLATVAHQLRAEARRVERRWQGPGGHPIPVILRGTARRLDAYTVSEESLASPLPLDVVDVLSHVVVILAQQSRPEDLRAVALKLNVYDEAGAPDPALVVRSPRWVASVLSSVHAAIERVNTKAKVYVSVVVTIALGWLLLRHQLPLAGLSSWKP